MSKQTLRILVSRHSAFYSPLIATLAGGFLERQGLDASYGVLPPGRTSRDALESGDAHVIQSAVSSNWEPMEKGLADLPVHFAQINSRDGFFLAAREPVERFDWKQLEGRVLLADHARQPLAMLRFAAHVNGADWSRIHVRDCGSPEQMEEAFRRGEGDYIHLQGPAPQQLELEGVAQVAVAVGRCMPAVAFSSLTATRRFLQTEIAHRFLQAYREAKQWAASADPGEIARAEQSFFPGVHPDALRRAIAHYQQLGAWAGGLDIPRELYEQALNVFQHCGLISRRHPYGQVVFCAASLPDDVP